MAILSEKSFCDILPIRNAVIAFIIHKRTKRGYKELNSNSDNAVRLILPMFQMKGYPWMRAIQG